MITLLRDALSRSGTTIVEEPAGTPESGARGFRVFPPSVAALGRAVAVVRAHGIPIEIRGSGDAPALPPPGGVLLDISALDRIGAVDGDALIARAEAGCSVAALEAAARRTGATLGPLLPSVRAGSVGAWLAGPTRGERGVPGARRETAALAVAAVLADGRIAESRAAPRSATGPDLDHLSLGGEGALSVIAEAWVRLFPVAPVEVASWRASSCAVALDAVRALCSARLTPARARIAFGPAGARLACAWEGPLSARLDHARARRLLALPGEVRDGELGGWVRGAGDAPAVEVDATFPALAAWAASAGGAEVELQLLGLHKGGAFAVLSRADAAGADAGAVAARAAGLRVLAPRRLRDAGPGWAQAGAGAVWERLREALGIEDGAPPPGELR